MLQLLLEVIFRSLPSNTISNNSSTDKLFLTSWCVIISIMQRYLVSGFVSKIFFWFRFFRRVKIILLILSLVSRWVGQQREIPEKKHPTQPLGHGGCHQRNWSLTLSVLIYEHWKQKFTIKWTASSEFGTYCLCEQRRFRRACASAQSRQNLRCSLIQAVSQEEPSDRKPDPWPLWMAWHAQLKFVMTECSKTQIRLTRPIWHQNWHADFITYWNDPSFLDKPVWANIVDPDQGLVWS